LFFVYVYFLQVLSFLSLALSLSVSLSTPPWLTLTTLLCSLSLACLSLSRSLSAPPFICVPGPPPLCLPVKNSCLQIRYRSRSAGAFCRQVQAHSPPPQNAKKLDKKDARSLHLSFDHVLNTLRKSLPLLHIPSWPNMTTDMRSNRGTVVSPDIPTKVTVISFLTPVLAGEVAHRLLDTGHRLEPDMPVEMRSQ